MWPLYVSTLCGTNLCEHSMCGHSMCEHSMWALYVWPLYGSTLCVATLIVTTLWEHSMCGHSMWALYVGPFYVSTLCVATLCVSTLCVTTLCEHEHRKVRKLPRKMYISSWAGCCRTAKSRKITTKTRLQFLGRMLQRQKRQKSTSFIVKTPFKSIAEHRKVRELPRKMNIEEVEAPKKYENLQTKPAFRPFQEHRRTPKSTRITTKNEHRRSWEAGNYENLQTKPVSRRPRPPENYENSQTKRTCKHETTKIAMNSARHPSATSI